MNSNVAVEKYNMDVHFGAAHAQRLYQLLFTKRQRLDILLAWHCSKPVKVSKQQNTLVDVWREFIEILLYCPPDLAFTHDGLFPFGLQHRGFCIPIEYLYPKAARLVLLLYAAKKSTFSQVKLYGNNKFMCSDFAHSKNKNVFPAPWRRALLLQFCFYLEVNPQFRTWYRVPMMKAVQSLLLKESRGHGDVFLLALCRALQGLCELSEVQTWGNFHGDDPPLIINT